VKREEMMMLPGEYRRMFEFEDAYWWYRGVRVLLQALLARYTPTDSRNALILDAGCGTGANMKLLESYGKVIGVDISEEAIGFCRARGISRARAFVASLKELPFPTDFFDLIISYEVICNIADDTKAFAEIARALKPHGCMIVQLPAYQWLWSRHDVAVGHQRRYSARDLRAKIAQAGLKIERVTHANALLLPFVAAERLLHRRVSADGSLIHSDLELLPNRINNALSALFTTEMRAVSHVDFPYGLSLVAVARKPADRRPQAAVENQQSAVSGR
jgi:SAM-dependent methyltransferase